MSDTVVDARGLKCPLPVLKLEKALVGVGAGETIAVLATDPVARIAMAAVPGLGRGRGTSASRPRVAMVWVGGTMVSLR